jgi:hypothetical protein
MAEGPFPVGGERTAVEDALTKRQFRMSPTSDKCWVRLDGLEAHVYATGSRLRVYKPGRELICDKPMAEALAEIDQIRSPGL